jgi:hypothetical protein
LIVNLAATKERNFKTRWQALRWRRSRKRGKIAHGCMTNSTSFEHGQCGSYVLFILVE